MNRKVCILNGSQSCEISGFLLQKTINFLRLNGYAVKDTPRGCGTVLVNSCVSVDSKKNDAEEVLDEVLRDGKRRVILFGCLAGIPNKYKEHSGVVQVGPKNLGALNALFRCAVPIEAVPVAALGCEVLAPYQTRLKGKDHYVLISQGCLNRCSYCTIRKAKGLVTSRKAPEILGDIKLAAAAGVKEVTLLADDCGSYGADLGTDLAALLSASAAASPAVKIKIYTIYPGALLRLFPKLRPLFAAGRISYINIPIQSGSQRILGLMERRYDVNKVLKIVGEIRKLSPGTWTYTHVILNFPTETNADFMRSLKASLNFNEALYIGYAANRGTKASLLKPAVGREEGKKRLKLAQAVLAKGRPGTVIPCAPERAPAKRAAHRYQ